jgi:3-phosphoshikimate 1-carboxyvinyltransferase
MEIISVEKNTLSVTGSHAHGLSGTVRVPGDKSVSHRALMLGAQVLGTTRISGLLEGEDVLATAEALKKLGVNVARHPTGEWSVEGVGIGGLNAPEDVLDMGNAGTGARLMLGLLATYPFQVVMTGDASLRSRPMARVTKPLTSFGATFMCREGDRLPLAMHGSQSPAPQTCLSTGKVGSAAGRVEYTR